MRSDLIRDAWRAMNASPLARIVGGGDCQAVGMQNFEAIRKRLGIDWRYSNARILDLDSRILDLGCGIGRTALASRWYGEHQILGIDIVPSMIGFCRQHVLPVLGEGSEFICLKEENALYTQLAQGHWTDTSVEMEDAEDIVSRHGSTCDFAMLHSVLTHQTPEMARATLRLTQRLLQSGGKAVVSCFIDTVREPHAPLFIADLGWTSVASAGVTSEARSAWTDAMQGERLNYCIWSLHTLSNVAQDAGLRLLSWHAGSRDGGTGDHPHDFVLLEKM